MPKRFNTHDATTQLINDWLKEAQGLPITLSLAKLGIRVIEAMNAAYVAGATADFSWTSQFGFTITHEGALQIDDVPEHILDDLRRTRAPYQVTITKLPHSKENPDHV